MTANSHRGTWGIRLLIRLFSVILGILIFWLLGFLVHDIETTRGPDYQSIEARHLDPALTARREDLTAQIADLDRTLANKREEQRLAGDSSQNLQRTINQLLDIQKLSMEKEILLAESDRENISVSLKHFLESQRNYQELNESLATLTTQRGLLDEERIQLERTIELARKPARIEYETLMKKHRLKLASFQLLILIPLLALGLYLLIAKRGSIYYPMFLAFGGASLVKVGLVMHKYFPTRYFKYFFTLALIIAVIRILIYFIEIVVHPKKEWLDRKNREAYERFLCPICEYPIRIGPRKFLYWTRRTVHKVLPQGEATLREQPYTCPSCGTTLFEQCCSCQGIRHSLLSSCEHCGATKTSQ